MTVYDPLATAIELITTTCNCHLRTFSCLIIPPFFPQVTAIFSSPLPCTLHSPLPCTLHSPLHSPLPCNLQFTPALHSSVHPCPALFSSPLPCTLHSPLHSSVHPCTALFSSPLPCNLQFTPALHSSLHPYSHPCYAVFCSSLPCLITLHCPHITLTVIFLCVLFHILLFLLHYRSHPNDDFWSEGCGGVDDNLLVVFPVSTGITCQETNVIINRL